MQRKTSIAAKVAVLASAVMLTGCAFVPDTVHTSFKESKDVAQISEANLVKVSITIKNNKKHGNVVSVTKDAYGIKMANVYMAVKRDFRKAIITALKERGFEISESSPISMILDIDTFYFEAHPGFLSGSQTGEARVEVTIARGNDREYKKTFVYDFDKKGLESVFTQYRHQAAQKMLSIIVTKIVTDPQVIDALFKAAGKTPPADLGVTVPASVASH
jgi:uncharacterized lipoprotein YajG